MSLIVTSVLRYSFKNIILVFKEFIKIIFINLVLEARVAVGQVS